MQVLHVHVPYTKSREYKILTYSHFSHNQTKLDMNLTQDEVTLVNSLMQDYVKPINIYHYMCKSTKQKKRD